MSTVPDSQSGQGSDSVLCLVMLPVKHEAQTTCLHPVLSMPLLPSFSSCTWTCGPLAGCLIYAQPLLAHYPDADDNSLIGCTMPRPDR